MADPPDPADAAGKGTLAEARAIVATYHQEQLRALLEHVREGIARLHAGEIDEFEADGMASTDRALGVHVGSCEIPTTTRQIRQ